MKRYIILRIVIPLAVAGFLASLILVEGSGRGAPRSDNFQYAGMRAFTELLKADGAELTINKRIKPEFPRGALVIAVVPMETRRFFDFDQSQKTDEFNMAMAMGGSDFPEETAHSKALSDFAQAGGTVVLIRTHQFPAETPSANFDLISETWPARKISWYEPSEKPNGQGHYKTIVHGEWGEAVDYKSVGQGHWFEIPMGDVLSNGLIKQLDNAQFGLDIGRLRGSQNRVIFCDAMAGSAENPGLFDLLGPWAFATRNQIFFCLLMATWAWGTHFGARQAKRRVNRSGRDFVLAMADAIRSGPAVGIMAKTEQEDCRRRIAKTRGMDGRTPWEELWPHLPGDLKEAVRKVDDLRLSPGVKFGQALEVVREMRRLTESEENFA